MGQITSSISIAVCFWGLGLLATCTPAAGLGKLKMRLSFPTPSHSSGLSLWRKTGPGRPAAVETKSVAVS